MSYHEAAGLAAPKTVLCPYCGEQEAAVLSEPREGVRVKTVTLIHCQTCGTRPDRPADEVRRDQVVVDGVYVDRELAECLLEDRAKGEPGSSNSSKARKREPARWVILPDQEPVGPLAPSARRGAEGATQVERKSEVFEAGIPAEIWARLSQEAEARGRRVASLVFESLEEYLQ